MTPTASPPRRRHVAPPQRLLLFGKPIDWNVLAMLTILIWWVGNIPSRYDSETMVRDQQFSWSALFQYFVIAFAALLLFYKPDIIINRLGRAWGWVALLGWGLMTALWSVSPKSTIFTIAGFSATAIVIAFLSSKIDERMLSRLLARFLVVFCLVNLAVAAVAPQYGMMTTSKFVGQLRGIYSHKNILGDTASLFLLWTICAYFAGFLQRRLAFMAIGFGLFTLILAWSVTAVAMIAICFGLLLFLTSARGLKVNGVWLTILIVAIVVAGVVIVPIVSSALLDAVGKDPTLTGRDVIWKAYLRLAAQRPMTGYGFNAIQESKTVGINIRWLRGGASPSAHNSFIQMYVGWGAPATIFYLVLNLRLILRGVALLGSGNRLGLFYIVFPVGYAINSFMEGIGGVYGNIGFLLLLYMTMRHAPKLARTRGGMRRQPRSVQLAQRRWAVHSPAGSDR